MKIILSRKGFDSSNGGIVSPIFEDGTMMSFPIPSKNDKDTYDDLNYQGQTYTEILSSLNYNEEKFGMHCHADPDLDESRRTNKIEGWVPAFGQVNQSAAYLLDKVGVCPGDLFLFFGNFHFVELKNGEYKKVRNSGDYYRDNDIQAVWGYLQIGEIITDPDEQKKYFWHPHGNSERLLNSSCNIIFTAAEHLSFDESRKGSGLLKFDEKRVLTLKGANKATWKYNDIYDAGSIIGKRHNSVSPQFAGRGIYYAGIWQELGLKETEKATAWAEEILS